MKDESKQLGSYYFSSSPTIIYNTDHIRFNDQLLGKKTILRD